MFHQKMALAAAMLAFALTPLNAAADKGFYVGGSIVRHYHLLERPHKSIFIVYNQ